MNRGLLRYAGPDMKASTVQKLYSKRHDWVFPKGYHLPNLWECVTSYLRLQRKLYRAGREMQTSRLACNGGVGHVLAGYAWAHRTPPPRNVP